MTNCSWQFPCTIRCAFPGGEALFELYQEEYERTLSGGGTVPDERRREAISAWPEDLQAVARQLKGRAVSDALDDRNRLADAAGIIRKGLEGLVASEEPVKEGFPCRTTEPESRCREFRTSYAPWVAWLPWRMETVRRCSA